MPLMMSGDAPPNSSYPPARFSSLTVTKKFNPMASRGGGQGGDGQRGGMGANRGANSRARLLSSKVSAPRPINLPSLRLEHAGLDPNVALVPTGTAGWGSTSASPAPPLSSSPGSARTITPPLIIGSPSSLEASSKAAYRKDRENGAISNVQARQAPKTWGNVAPNNSGGGRVENELPEYPTAAEAVKGWLKAEIPKINIKDDPANGTVPMTKTVSSMSFDSTHREEKWDEMEDEVLDFSNTVLEFADGTTMKVRTPVDQKSEEDSDSSDTDRPARKVKTDSTIPLSEGAYITPADRFTDDYDRSYPRTPDRRGEEPSRERSEWDRDHQHERDGGGYMGRGGYHGQQQQPPPHERGSGFGRSYRYGDRWKGSSFEEHRGRGRGDGGPGRYGGGRYDRRDSFDKESGGVGEGGHFERRGSFEHTQPRREGGIGTYVARGDSRERSQETWNGAGGGGGGPSGTPGFERSGSWDRRDGAGGAEFHPTLLQRPRRMSSVSNKSDRSSERGTLPVSEQGGASSPPVSGSRQYSILQHDRDRAAAPFHPPRRAVVTEQSSAQAGTAMTQAEEIGEAMETTAIDRPEEVTVIQKEVMMTAAEKAKKRREDEEAAYVAAQARAKAKADELAKKADIENAGRESREKEGETPVRSDEAVVEEGDRDNKDQAEERPRDVIKQNTSDGEKTAAMAKWAALPAILEQEERDRKERSKRDGRDTRLHFRDERGGRVGTGEGEHGLEEWPVGEDVERYRRPEKTSSSSTSASVTGSNTSSWQRPRKYNGNGSYDSRLQPPGQEHAAPRGPSHSWDRDRDRRTPSPSPRPQEALERSPRPVKIADIEHVMSKIREEFRAKGTSIEEIKSMGPSSSTQSRKEDNVMVPDAVAEARTDKETAGGSNNTRTPVAHAQQKGEEPMVALPKIWRRTENHAENSLWDSKNEGKASSSLAPTPMTMNNWNNTMGNREVEQHQSIPSDAWGVSDARERENVPIVHLAKRPSVSSASGVTAAATAESPKNSPAAVVTDPQNESRALDMELFDGKGPAQRQSIKLPARRASQDIQGANQSAEPGRTDALDDPTYYGGGAYGRGGVPFRGRDRGVSERGRGGNMMRSGATSSRGGGFLGRGAAVVGPLPPTGRGGSGEQGQSQFDDFRGRGIGRGRGRGRGAGNSGAFGEPRDLGIATVALTKGAEVVEAAERMKQVSRADTATSWRREEPVGAANDKAPVTNNDRALDTKQEVEVIDFNGIPPAGAAAGSGSGAMSVSALAAAAEEDEEFTEIKGKKKKKNKGAAAVGGNFASLTPDNGTATKPSDSVRKLVQDHLTDNNKDASDARSSFSTGHSSGKGRRESIRENEAGRRASVTTELVAAKAVDKVTQVSKIPDEMMATSAVTIEQQSSKMAQSTPKSLSPAPIPKLVRKKSLLVDATEPIFPAEFDIVVNRKPAGIRFTVESEISSDEGILGAATNSLVDGDNIDQEFESSSKLSENLVPGPLLTNTWGTLPTALPVITQKSLTTPQQQQVEELWKAELDESTHTPTENSLRDLKADQDSVAEFPSSMNDLSSETGSTPEIVIGSIPNTIEKSLAPNVSSATTPSSAPSISHRHNPIAMGPGPRQGLLRPIDPSRMQHDPRMIPNQFYMYPMPMGTNAPGMPGSVVYSSSPDQQAMYWPEASQNLARSQSADTTMATAMGSPSMSFNPPTSVPQQRPPIPFWVMQAPFVSPQYMSYQASVAPNGPPMMVPVAGMQWQQAMSNRPPVSPQPNAHTLQRPLMTLPTTRPDHFQPTPPMSPHPKSQRPNSRKDNGNANSTGVNATSAPSLPSAQMNSVIPPKNGPMWSQAAVPGNPRYQMPYIHSNPQVVPGASRERGGWIGPLPNGPQQRPFVPNNGNVNVNGGRGGGMHRVGFVGRGGYPGPNHQIRGP